VILAREQINRYLRHILIPEVSGPGQKKLLESSVFICGETVKDTAAAIDYLAAAGVGRIECQFNDNVGVEELLAGIHDLNDDVVIGVSDGSQCDFRIFLGRPEFILQKQEMICNAFVPTVISLFRSWTGGQQIFRDSECLCSFMAALAEVQQETGCEIPGENIAGEIFSSCVLAALSALEVIKLSLTIGGVTDDFCYFNLLSMDFFKRGRADLKHALIELCTPRQADVYESGLEDRKVLIVGAGGLGSPVAYALALAGVNTLGLVDYDTVEISNLNRQILHTTSRIGIPKVESAAVFLKHINPGLSVILYNTSLSKENIFDIIADYDVVIVAVDNFPTRFLLNDACFFVGKPMIDAGVIRFDGTARTILPHKSPCYRCTLAAIPAAGTIPSCAESGVLGPVPGIMGFIQAAEAVKWVTGQGKLLSDSMLFFDGKYSEFVTIKLNKNPGCPLCGTNPAIHQLQEYGFQCEDARNEEDKANKSNALSDCTLRCS